MARRADLDQSYRVRLRIVPRSARLATSLLAAVVAGCGPHPTRLPEATANGRVELALPAPSTDAFGHPYRWLSLGKLKYLELVLGGADPGDTLPIAVLIHGLGDHPRIPTESDREEFPIRVLLPEAPLRWDAGKAWYPIRVRDGRPEDMAKALRQTTNELAGFLAAAEERYSSPCPPLVAGFSQGGIVTWALAVRHPGAISAAFPMAAWLPPELASEANERARELPPLRMMHGDRDEVVPFAATRNIVEALEARGADIELEAAPGVGHDLSAGMKRRLARFFGEGAARCVGAQRSSRGPVAPQAGMPADADRFVHGRGHDLPSSLPRTR